MRWENIRQLSRVSKRNCDRAFPLLRIEGCDCSKKLLTCWLTLWNKNLANLRRDFVILLNMEADDLLRRYAAGERDFTEADLSWEDLSGANLSQIILGNANLNETNLSKTNLSNADLMGADLRKELFDSEHFFQLPVWLTPPVVL
jgi:uncharacterized protein YjbI with pentapeptide repeats